MSAPAVTVCLPTYNYGHYLGGAIASVLDQTFEDFELLIADDVSTDNTVDVVQPFLDDPRVQFLPNKVNSGMFDNFNRCIDLARGRYIKFLMADDWLAASCLEKSVELLETNPEVSILTTASWQIDDRGRVFAAEHQFPFETSVIGRSRAVEQLATGTNAVGMPTGVLLRTEALRAAGGFDATSAPAADIDLWLRMLANSDLAWINERLVFLRIHSGHTHVWGDDPHESWMQVWRDAPGRTGGFVTEGQMRTALGRWSTKLSTFAVKHLFVGHPRRALELWRSAARQIGSRSVAYELLRSLPQTLSARKVRAAARRESRLVEYRPNPELGPTIEEAEALADSMQGRQLQRVVRID